MRAGPGCNRRAVTSATPRLCEEGGWWQAAREARARGTSSWGRLSEVRCGGWWVAGVEWRFARARGGCQSVRVDLRRVRDWASRARQTRHSHTSAPAPCLDGMIGSHSRPCGRSCRRSVRSTWRWTWCFGRLCEETVTCRAHESISDANPRARPHQSSGFATLIATSFAHPAAPSKIPAVS